MATRLLSNDFQGTGIQYSDIAVPQALNFSAYPKPIDSVIISKYASSTSSTTLNPGDTIRFEIPCSKYLCGDVYVKFTVTHKNVRSRGAGQEFRIGSIRLPSGSCYFRRVQTSIGSVTLDSINDYNRLYCAAVSKGNVPVGYQYYDGSFEGFQLSNSVAIPDNGNCDPADVMTLCVPLLGIFSDESKMIPLELINSSSLVVQIELEQPNKIFGPIGDGTNDASYNYSISNPKLFYSVCDPGAQYTETLRSQLAQSPMGMRIPYVTYSGSPFSNPAGNFNQLIAENCSSLLGVLVCRQPQDLPIVADAADIVASTLADSFFNGFQTMEVRSDGQMSPGFTIEDPTHAFVELQKTFSALFDVQKTGIITYRSFRGTKDCVLGVSFVKHHDGGLSSVGTKVNSNIQIEITSNGADAFSCYVWLAKEFELIVTPTGDIMIKK